MAVADRHSQWMLRMLAIVFVGLAVGIHHSVGTTVAADATGAREDRVRTLSSKIALLQRLISGSPTADRIRRASNAEATALLADASQAWQQADAALLAGDLDGCDGHVRAGLAAMQRASGLVADTRRAAEDERARYGQLSQRVASFTEAFERILAEKQDAAVTALLDRERFDGLLLAAQASAREENYADANRKLATAADMVEGAVSRARDKETLLHELNFATPRDEFDYEKQRNRSYELLVGLLKAEQGGSDARLAYMEKLIETNRNSCAHAERLAAEGDVRAGIERLEQATDTLARALRASGVAF